MNSLLIPIEQQNENENPALDFASQLSGSKNTKLSLVSWYNYTKLDDTLRKRNEIRKKLKSLINQINLPVKHRCYLREGNVIGDIQKIIKKAKIDLLLTNILDNKNVPNKEINLIQQSNCPVLTFSNSNYQNEFSSILFSVNDNLFGKKEYKTILSLAIKFDLKLILFISNNSLNKQNYISELLNNTVLNNRVKITFSNNLCGESQQNYINSIVAKENAIFSLKIQRGNIFNNRKVRQEITSILRSTHFPILWFTNKNLGKASKN